MKTDRDLVPTDSVCSMPITTPTYGAGWNTAPATQVCKTQPSHQVLKSFELQLNIFDLNLEWCMSSLRLSLFCYIVVSPVEIGFAAHFPDSHFNQPHRVKTSVGLCMVDELCHENVLILINEVVLTWLNRNEVVLGILLILCNTF